MDQLYHASVEPVLLDHIADAAPDKKAASAALLRVLQRIPKTDFHCHLNGSITPALLAHMERLLLHEKRRRCNASITSDEQDTADVLASPTAADKSESDLLFFNTQEKRMRNVLASPTAEEVAATGAPPGASTSHSSPKDRMNYCFTVFDAIYKIMTNLAFTRLAVQDMLLCSAAENIVVMEIRTSLRDGLTRSFKSAGQSQGETNSTAAAAADAATSETVSKQMYVDVVIETVEHLLSGGLVDFETGELLSLDESASVVANFRVSTGKGKEEKDDDSSNDETGVRQQAQRWWAVYDRVYGALFTSQLPPCHQEPSANSAFPSHSDAATRLAQREFFATHIQANFVQRMHVRLLLSINRGAPVDAAWEAARLTSQTQQRQVRTFHAWCSEAAEDVSSTEVRQRLRRTCWVTGMDLSGNCYRGLYTTFNAALAAARTGRAADAEENKESGEEVKGEGGSDGLPSKASALPLLRTTAAVTIHGGEKQDAAELGEMVTFAPERWGHLVFTDDANLSRILSAQQGIELCLTSNLLTSGHADVAEHHLGHMLDLWDALPGSRGASVDAAQPLPLASTNTTTTATVLSCYASTERARLMSRLRFVAHRSGNTAHPPDVPPADSVEGGGVYTLPNLSFHTDDRGVFGTTLSDELLLASQHPGVARLCARLVNGAGAKTEETTSIRDFAHFFWMLERLSLCQIFELPVPVQLLAATLMTNNSTVGQGSEPATMTPGQQPLTKWLSACACAKWRNWDGFVRLYEEVSATQEGGDASTLPAALSAWEWAWLTEDFDHYYP